MNPRIMFTINTVVAVLFGLAFTLVPDKVVANYGTEIFGPGGTAVARLFGAALISLGVVSWAMRSSVDSPERDGVMLAILIGDAIGFVVSLLAVLRGAVNALGWSTVVIYLLLGLGFAYLRFMKPAD